MPVYNMLVSDDDGHWYIIPETREDDFEKWVEKEDPEEPIWCNRVDNPHRVRFFEWHEV